MKKFGLLVLLLASSISLGQTLLLEENFNFTGDLTANGWTAHSGAGTQPINTTTGLSYAGYPSSGIGNAALLDNTGEDVNRTFAEQTTGFIYYSFLVNVTTGPQGYFIHLGNSATTFASRVFVQPSVNPGKINFGMSNSSTITTVAWGTTDFDPGTTYLIIVKHQIAAPTGTNDVWVLSSGVPATEAAAGTPEVATSVGTGLASITGIYLRQYSATQNIVVDGIRVATGWAQAPLPVELSSFSASVIGSTVKLNWQTATEINNFGFEVERKILKQVQNDNTNWEKIGFVNGNGNSNSPKNYSYVDDNVTAGTYSYRLKQIDNDGTIEYSSEVEAEVAVPKKFELAQNYPNPFNPATTIRFNLPEAGNVKLTIYNILGQEIRTLVNEYKESGVHTINFDASELNSGMYIYKIEANGFTQTRKMTLVK